MDMREVNRLAARDYPSIEVAGHLVHVFQSGNEWHVWINTQIEEFDGLCVGVGPTRDAAVTEAVAALETITAFLQEPPNV